LSEIVFGKGAGAPSPLQPTPTAGTEKRPTRWADTDSTLNSSKLNNY